MAPEHEGDTNGPDGYLEDTRQERSNRDEGYEATEPEWT